MQETVAKPTLPIWPTVQSAWAMLAIHPGAALVLAVPAANMALAARIVRPAIWPGVPDSVLAENVVFFFANMNLHILAFAAAMPMLAAWHRLVAEPAAATKYRVSDVEWGYLWRAVGLFVFVYLIAIPGATVFGLMHGHLAALADHFDAPSTLLQMFSLPAYGLVAGIILRLCLILPTAACGDAISYSDSWQGSQGNTWRLAAAAGLTIFPIAAVWLALEMLPAPASLGPLVAREVVNVSLAMITLYLAAGLISIAEVTLSTPEVDE